MTRSFDASHIDSFASGAWPLLSWVSDGTRELCLQSGQELRARCTDHQLNDKGNLYHQKELYSYRYSARNECKVISCCQFLVGEMLSNYRNYEAIQPLKGVAA